MRRVGLSADRARPLARAMGRWVLGPDLPVEVQRRRLELFSRTLPPVPGLRTTQTTLGGVPCEHLTVRCSGDRVLLYLHGGAYVTGSPRTHRGSAAGLAAGLGAEAWVLDYRLAPEHPHPAALEDALAAYRALLGTGVAPGRLVVAGDSAGAGLTLALAMALRDAGDPLPAALGLVCPWADLAADLARTRPPAPREALLHPDWLRRSAAQYARDLDPRMPGISPLHGDLRGLPPIVMSSAGDDLLRGDADALEARAAAAGARLVHQRHGGVWHVFHAFADVMPQAAFAVGMLGQSLLAECQ